MLLCRLAIKKTVSFISSSNFLPGMLLDYWLSLALSSTVCIYGMREIQEFFKTDNLHEGQLVFI